MDINLLLTTSNLLLFSRLYSKDTDKIVSEVRCMQKKYSPPFSNTAFGAVSKVPLRIVQYLLR
jgi:hypothetical protein